MQFQQTILNAESVAKVAKLLFELKEKNKNEIGLSYSFKIEGPYDGKMYAYVLVGIPETCACTGYIGGGKTPDEAVSNLELINSKQPE